MEYYSSRDYLNQYAVDLGPPESTVEQNGNTVPVLSCGVISSSPASGCGEVYCAISALQC